MMPATLLPVTDPIMVAWGNHLAAKGRSRGTVEMRQRYAMRLLAGRDPSSLTTEDIEGWLAAHSHWSPATRRSAIASIQAFYAWWSQRSSTVSPAEGLEAPPESPPCPKPCPDEVYDAALERAEGSRYWLLRVAGSTGLRRAELAELHSDSVEGHFVRVVGKGSKARRVPLPVDVRRWLLGRDGWAWPSKYGGHVMPDAVGRRITRLLGHPWTAHTLRHRYATRTYAHCGSLVVVQRLLGHASLATTQRYLATGDDELELAITWAERPTLRLVG